MNFKNSILIIFAVLNSVFNTNGADEITCGWKDGYKDCDCIPGGHCGGDNGISICKTATGPYNGVDQNSGCQSNEVLCPCRCTYKECRQNLPLNCLVKGTDACKEDMAVCAGGMCIRGSDCGDSVNNWTCKPLTKLELCSKRCKDICRKKRGALKGYGGNIDLCSKSCSAIFCDNKEVARRGRRLIELDNPELVDCDKAIYQLGLEIMGSSHAHLAFIAKAQCKSEEESCECPSLLFDSVPDLVDGNLDHAIHVLNKQDDLISDGNPSLMIGSFYLQAILDAFAAASNHYDETRYDFMSNNCASLLISMGHSLDIDPADEQITSFVVKHISNEFIMDNILETDAETVSIKQKYNGDNTAAVVEEFISNYIYNEEM